MDTDDFPETYLYFLPVIVVFLLELSRGDTYKQVGGFCQEEKKGCSVKDSLSLLLRIYIVTYLGFFMFYEP